MMALAAIHDPAIRMPSDRIWRGSAPDSHAAATRIAIADKTVPVSASAVSRTLGTGGTESKRSALAVAAARAAQMGTGGLRSAASNKSDRCTEAEHECFGLRGAIGHRNEGEGHDR